MKQDEIWLITLDPTIGAEIKKTRPAIIVNDSRYGKLPLKLIVPITDWQNRYNDVQWMVKLIPDISNGLTKESAADCFQIRCLSEERFIRRLGKANEFIMEKVRRSLAQILNI